MKNIKTKTISIVLIGFLCILIGSPFIKGETTTKTLAPNQYWGLGTTLNAGDTLNFRIESSPVSIDIYIMNQAQIDSYIANPNSGIITYFEGWTHMLLLTSSFVAESSQQYYVLMINPSDSTSTYVVVDASVDEYVIPKTITIDDPIDIFDYGYIYWTYTGDIDYVQIDLYKDGYFLEIINLCTDNDGFYSWYIDDYMNSSYYQIKISDYYDSSIYDYSAYFTIECEVVDPIDPIDPIDPFGNTPISVYLLIFIGIIGIVGGSILIGISIKKHRNKRETEIIQPQKEVKTDIQSSKFCSNCGSTIVLGNSYCSKCGNKWQLT